MDPENFNAEGNVEALEKTFEAKKNHIPSHYDVTALLLTFWWFQTDACSVQFNIKLGLYKKKLIA